MQSRVSAARLICDNYEMSIAQDKIIGQNNIMPNIELLNKSIELGKHAVINNKEGYSSNRFGFE